MLSSNKNVKNIIDLCSDDIVKQTEAAFAFSKEEFSHKKVVEYLKSEESSLKHLALIKIQEIENQEEALILVKCLSDKDSRVRELASQFIKSIENLNLFLSEEIFKTFINSIGDSNPSVCRNIADILATLVKKTDYPLLKGVIDKINENIELNNVFPLYWSLYTLEKMVKNTKITEETLLLIEEILKQTTLFKEYQIRERTAFIVKALLEENNHNPLFELVNLFKKDSVFYVRRVFY